MNRNFRAKKSEAKFYQKTIKQNNNILYLGESEISMRNKNYCNQIDTYDFTFPHHFDKELRNVQSGLPLIFQ